jgi:serine/threonine protein kinase
MSCVTVCRYKKFEKEIGVGAYGTVYKATDLETNQLVALKRIPLEESEDGIPATAVREMSLLKQLHHPNIVSLQNIVLEINLLYLVFELGDLDLKKLMDLAFKEKTHGTDGASTSSNSLIANMKYHDVFCMDAIRSNMHQIIDGLAYCHSMGVMHRDLKPQNILVSLSPGVPGSSSSCQFRIKIADFGLARAFMPKRELTLEVVTRWYRPPEILLGSNTYSPSVDIWSIGTCVQCLLLYLCICAFEFYLNVVFPTIGCIFAELLNQGIPLLPGSSEIDQIHKIFYHFGTPDGISWPDVVNYPHWRPTFPLWPPLAWGSIVPYDFDKTPPAAIDLLAVSRCFFLWRMAVLMFTVATDIQCL